MKRAFVAAAMLLAALAGPASAQMYGPPAPRYERIPPQRPGAVWDRGHWRWNGRQYVWVPGRWQYGHGRWIAGHWRQGPRGGWHWIPGHWS